MDDKKKKIGLVIATILLVLVFVVGITYSITIFTGGSDINSIRSGKISMNYTESSNVINLTNALPVTDEVGKNQTDYFDFSITSNADTNADDNEGIKIPYNLIIEPKTVDSDKDALTNEQIKVYLTKVEGATETQVLAPTKISALTPVDTNFNLYSTENVHKNNNGMVTTNYRLRAWIDYGVDTSTWNQTSKPKQYKFGVNVNATGELNGPATPAAAVGGAKTIIDKVGTDGLVEESHPATEQLIATTDYRYTGANPNNYIKFNNDEKPWRIIGVFDVDDGTGKLEKRIKIIRDSIGNIEWNSNSINDWTKATGMKLLNEGDYWNRTGDYALNGLTPEAKGLIADAKWYLGAITSDGFASRWYGYERGTEVITGRQTSWVGKVGLMYPSDYGYATSGGTTKNRQDCLAKEMARWYTRGDASFSDCYNNDWLYDSSNHQWTFSIGSSRYETPGLCVYDKGNVGGYEIYSSSAFRPTVYLKFDIQITGGSGTSESPYEISLN